MENRIQEREGETMTEHAGVVEQFMDGRITVAEAMAQAIVPAQREMIAQIAAARTAASRADYNRVAGHARGRCSNCGCPDADWNAGAGRYLCVEHWDEY